MAFCLQANELASDGLKRIVNEELRFAIRQMGAGKNLHGRVHDARKSLKRARSLLRLIKRNLGPSYSEENRRLRVAGQDLSKLRDTQAILETLADFAKKHRMIRKLASLRLAFDQKQQNLEAQHNWDQKLDEIGQELIAVDKRVENWSLHHLAAAPDLIPALREGYRQARRAFIFLRTDRTAERFHELRKRTKTHLCQLRIVNGIAGGAWERRIAELKILSDWLGDQHNFVVLIQGLPHEEQPAQSFRQLLSIMARDRQTAEARALLLAEKLYAQKPKEFITLPSFLPSPHAA